MFLKNHQVQGSEVSGQLISLGGTKMEDGRTWGSSQDLMSRSFKITNSSIDLGKLSTLKSFQITASHKNRTSSGSSTPRLMNAAACDLENETSTEIKAILYGGQSVDNALTSDEIVLIQGTICEDLSKAKIDVTRYPAYHNHYTEFGVPQGWPDGSHLAQSGEIPEGRTGSKLSFLRKSGSSDLLVSIGGHTKSDYSTDFHHPESSISLLLVPQMRWWKLQSSDRCRRSFHSQSSNSNSDVYILGGKSMKDHRWAVVHPLIQIIKIHIEEDFTYSETVINLTTDIIELPFLTNFSSCGRENLIFVFGGFTFPEYKQNQENLYNFLPPIANRNKLPKLCNDLFKIDLVQQNISVCSTSEDSGAYGGSVVFLSGPQDPPELLLHADPKIILYSERILDPPKCELAAEFGSCSLPVVDKKKEFYICATPICSKKIHIKCDKNLKGKPSEHQFCPTCRNIDPKTWKPVPGAKRPRFRRK